MDEVAALGVLINYGCATASFRPLQKALYNFGWNGPLARSGGLPARQSTALQIRDFLGVILSRTLGGKLPPRTAKLAVPPNPNCMIPV